MPGVKEVESYVFNSCKALDAVECDKLEIIRDRAFCQCRTLRSINLPSARIVDAASFFNCNALTDVKFSNKLESLGALGEEGAFGNCFSLERITLPLKDGIITTDNTFKTCHNLRYVDLVEGEVLRESVASLLLDDWRNDMNEEIDSINRILPNANAGHYGDDDEGRFVSEGGEKAQVIRAWIRSVLHKIIYYKAEHRRLLREAASILQFALPRDILMNNVLSFLELPSYSFEGEDETDDSDEE